MNQLAITKLREVQTLITYENFDMFMWENECGTTRCIGGWLRHLLNVNNYQEVRNLLEISCDQWDNLCYVSHWPSECYDFDDNFDKTVSIEQAKNRIDLFIATDGEI